MSAVKQMSQCDSIENIVILSSLKHLILFYFSTFSLNKGYQNGIKWELRLCVCGVGTIAASVILCVALYCVASVRIRNVLLEIASPALRQLDRNKTEY